MIPKSSRRINIILVIVAIVIFGIVTIIALLDRKPITFADFFTDYHSLKFFGGILLAVFLGVMAALNYLLQKFRFLIAGKVRVRLECYLDRFKDQRCCRVEVRDKGEETTIEEIGFLRGDKEQPFETDTDLPFVVKDFRKLEVKLWRGDFESAIPYSGGKFREKACLQLYIKYDGGKTYRQSITKKIQRYMTGAQSTAYQETLT